MFDQTQATINYMNVSKKMAEGLGILNAIDEDIIERLIFSRKNPKMINGWDYRREKSGLSRRMILNLIYCPRYQLKRLENTG